jgi:4-hydroxy-tetrahydrodipicolinate reductase
VSLRVLVVGALGRMGERIRALVAEDPAVQLGAALEASGHPGVGSAIEAGLAVGDDPKAALASCQVAIDFSVPAATLSVMRAAADAGVGYVCGTTGFSPAERAEIGEIAQRIPMVCAPNFSLSVNVLRWLSEQAARLLGDGYDAELLEIHHSAKRDAPSGTALHLGEAVAAGRGQQLSQRLVLERAGETGPRPDGAIGIQTLRGGDVAGEHTVMFVGQGERLELVHRASTRDHFARGAIRAAVWLSGRNPGLYTIEEIFGLPAQQEPPR